MHSTNFNTDTDNTKGGDVLVSVATLVTEGRIPGGVDSKSKKFYEGPHCALVKQANKEHICDLADSLCLKFETDREAVLNLCKRDIPLCIEVILTCKCKEVDDRTDNLNIYVLEQWHISVSSRRPKDPLLFNLTQLASAIRSQLYFSQITVWLTTQDDTGPLTISEDNFRYHLTAPGKTFATSSFHLSATKHDFPATDIGNGQYLTVSCLNLPRSTTIPDITCSNCAMNKVFEMDMTNNKVLDDRMHIPCKLKGKHRCEDLEEDENVKLDHKLNVKRLCSKTTTCEASTSKYKPKFNAYIQNSNHFASESQSDCCQKSFLQAKNDLNKDKGQLLLEAIERSGQNSTRESDIANCDKRESDIPSFSHKNNNFSVYVDKHCDSPVPTLRHKKMRDISNVDLKKRTHVRQKIVFDEDDGGFNKGEVPSQMEQAKFRKDLDSAASMVFHSRTGLPLTSSPAPVRRGKSCFDFDSSINSVSAIRSALYSTSFSTDEESESEGSIVSPCSPEILSTNRVDVPPVKYRRKGHSSGLLGSFEESVLNGRLEPVSTVHGFTAELGASGSFVPKHLVVPVTVFFYTLGETDKVSLPYLSHINLGKKGYNVPKSGTVQVTLFNPLGTVVKMFVIMYDLQDMPPNSQTFIRQRTLYMPTNCNDANLEWGPKWLRYLIHLRFLSSKSGKIYLHSDIRMIIFRKCDMDTATAHGIEMSYELRSFTHMPANPRYSPRK